MADPELIERTRSLFLRDDNVYGCAEVTLVALQEHWSLPDPQDSSAAMALNGGVAYAGGTCGAVTGAAMAVGRLAERRTADHRQAKKIARKIIQELMKDFADEQGSTDCRDLTGYDMTTEHEAFIASNIWRDVCMRQIEFAVARLAPLGDPTVWEAAVERLTAPGPVVTG